MLPPHPDDGEPSEELLKLMESKKDATSCEACLFVEYYMRKLLPTAVEEARTEANKESVDDALQFIEDSLECFHLYQGHRIRVCQAQGGDSDYLKEMYDEVVQTRKDGTKGKATIDWAMNYEGQRFAQAQTHHFGKRGYAWHVVSIFYYKWDPEMEQPVGVTVNIDQVMMNDNKKDWKSTLASMESLQMKIDAEIPQLEELLGKADNASNYQKKEIILSLPILNALSSHVKWVGFVHSETQDGKAGCDSHAAIGKRNVRKFLTTRDDKLEYKKVDTPLQLAEALGSNGGIQNTGKYMQLQSFPSTLVA